MSGKISSYFLRQVPERAIGSVHSVFASSFNVQVGSFLAHIGPDSSPLSCLGLNISRQRMQQILPCIRCGDQAVFRNGTLRIYDREAVSTLSFLELPIIPLEVSSGQALPSPELDRCLQNLNLPAQIGIDWDEPLLRTLDILRRQDAGCSLLQSAIHFLLGRGKGLTPSGDDILLGYGAGLLAWGNSDRFFHCLGNILSAQTTPVSIAYLRAMLDGCVNEDYQLLFQAISSGREVEYDALLDTIRHHGHTSGCDSLLGLHTAYQAVCPAPPTF